MTPITCARPSPPRVHSPSFPTTRHAHSNIRSTSIYMPSAISWNAASQGSNSSDASQPASKKRHEIIGPSSLSQPLSYGCGKCPHYLENLPLGVAGPGADHAFLAAEFVALARRRVERTRNLWFHRVTVGAAGVGHVDRQRRAGPLHDQRGAFALTLLARRGARRVFFRIVE